MAYQVLMAYSEAENYLKSRGVKRGISDKCLKLAVARGELVDLRGSSVGQGFHGKLTFDSVRQFADAKLALQGMRVSKPAVAIATAEPPKGPSITASSWVMSMQNRLARIESKVDRLLTAWGVE